MKITCPGCGKSYRVPQELVDRILAEHAAKRATPEGEFFQEMTAKPDASTPIVHHKGFFQLTHRTTNKVSVVVLVLAAMSIGIVFFGMAWRNFSEPDPAQQESILLVYYVTGLYAIALSVYLVPTGIAIFRRHPNAGAIAAVNILLGWTFLGYVAAVVWSLMAIADSIKGDGISRLR